MILQIKRGNKVIAESADFSFSSSLQEVRKLTCEVVSVIPIQFKAYNSKSESEYDTVVYNGNTFILYQAPSGDNLNEAGKYKYSLLFYGKEVLLQNVAFLDIVSGTGGEINQTRYTHGGLFQFWGDAKQLAARIEANIESYNSSLGAGYTGIGTWTLNVDAEGDLTEDMIDISDGTNLFDGLKNFYDKFYLNYYFSTTANGGVITITDKARPSIDWTFKQGDGDGAVKVSSSVDTSTPVITRIIPQGGSRNVPPGYKKDAKPVDESRYCPYILLPNDSSGNIRYYLDSEYGLKNYGVRGKTVSNTFSGVYPSIKGKKLEDLYPSGLPEWDTYTSAGEPDPQSGKVAGKGVSASTRIDKIIGSTPIKSDDSDSFFIYMTSPGFNLGYKVYEDGDSSDKINDNVNPQYKPHAMFDKYKDSERFDIYGTRVYYDQPVKVTATFSGKMLFSILPVGSDAVGKKVKINLRMVINRLLGQASPVKEVVIGEEGATDMLEIPFDKTVLTGYIEKGQNTTVSIGVEFTFDSDVPARSCKIGFSEEMTCNIHFGNQDGSQDRFYFKYASVTDAVFSMRTGTYTGTEFKINKNGIIPLYGEISSENGETEEDVAMFNKGARYKISCYRTDSNNAKLPLYTNGSSPAISEGTEFVILNIVMPKSYETMAENTLEKVSRDYLSRYDHENRTVSLDISSGFVAEHPNLFINFIEGNMLKVRDDGIGVFDFSDNGQIVDMQLQIQSLEIKYSKDNLFPSYSCTIARRKILSFYERLAQENQTVSTQNTTNVTLGGSGTGSGTNIFSEQLLNDLIASFQKFNGWFEWDEEKQALRCKSAFYTNQWISALGAQSGGGSPGGGGIIQSVYGFADLGKTFNNDTLTDTFNAYTINEIWKLAKEGGMNADKLWQELGKDDATKKIHISHLPDNKYVTIDTEQTVTANKIFTSQLSTANIVPSVNNASTLGLDTKRWENIYSVSANISGTITSNNVKTNSLQVGDIKIVYDSTNKAVTFEHIDGSTTIGLYTKGWISALGVSPGGGSGGSGLINNVYGYSSLGTTFSDTDLNNTFNAYTINEIWKMAKEGGLDATAMWNELKKADSSKVIDASHIPTSVLDGRWVKKAGDTMTGTLTSASTTGSIIFKGLENCDITNIYTNNGTLYGDTDFAIRNGLRFNWYDTYWYIGNLRGTSTNSSGFGIANESNKLCLQVTPDYTIAPVFRSSASQGTAPLIVYSTTLVSKLNSNYLEGYNNVGFIHSNYSAATSGTAYVTDDSHLMLIAEIGIDTTYSTYVILLSNEFWGHQHYSSLLLHIACTNNDNAGNVSPRCSVSVMSRTGSHARGVFYRVENNKAYIFLDVSGGNQYGRWASTILQNYNSVTTSNANLTGNLTLKFAFNQSRAGLSPANYHNNISVTSLSTSRTLWGQPFNGTANVSGDMTGVGSITMTGDLTMNNTKGVNIGWSTRVAKNSGVWIHGGADAASSTDANLRFASWYGIGWYPTIDTASGVRQGNNAMWLNVRYGNLNVAGGIKESTICIGRVNSSGEYDAAYNGEINRYDNHLFLQHHSGKNLIMCTGGGLAGIGTNSPGEKLHVAGNTRTDGYFRSTVGTGTQPYKCSSTTLNTNLNADLLDGYHQTAFSMGWTSSTKYRVDRWGGGQDLNWKKIVTYVSTGGGQYLSCKVKGTIYYITGNHNQGQVVDMPFEAIMYAYGGTANSMLNQSTLYLPPYCSWDLIRIVRYANNSWEVQVRQPSDWTNISLEYTVTNNGGSVSAGQFANTSYSSTVANNYNTNVSRPTSSRVLYADRLTTGRTINGTTFDGTANITTSYWGTTRTFYTNSHDSYRASSGVNVNGSGNVTLLLPNSIRCSDWFRSTGNTGWYHETYGGGWYMTDSSYIRNYNSKILRIQTDNYETIRLVRTSSSGGCSIAFYNGGGTFRGQFGMNSTSWFTFDTGTATANQNVVEISPAGGIHSKAEITAKASASDIRLKKDIQNYNAMDIINKFRSVKYHWNDVAKANSEVYNNDYDQFGLIAQDLIAGGFKQWVRDVFHDYYTVTYERLIPVVWKGLQEVDDEVTRLKKRVRELENRLGIYNQ